MGVALVGGIALIAGILMVDPMTREPLGEDEDPTLGNEEAPLSVHYFADFQCPSCRAFELEQLDALERDYVLPGKVRLVFKDFPIVGDDSWSAAEASQHVWVTTPERYWTWHRALYEAQGAERSGWASAQNLVAFSRTIPGVDAEGMAEALADHRALEEVRADRAQGTDSGVRGTPTIVVDGRALNALDNAGLRAAIEEALKA